MVAARVAKIGTVGVPFLPTNLGRDSVTGKVMKSQAISMMPEFKSKSLEELRFEDYYGAPAIPRMDSPGPTGLPGKPKYCSRNERF
jgi:hypothetical protein